MAEYDEERGLNPDRHLNRLIRAISVSKRIQRLAQAKIDQDAWNDEKRKEEELLEKAKEIRMRRIKSLEPVHIAILEMVASLLEISLDVAKDGMGDSDKHIELIKSVTISNGRRAIMFSYGLYNHPPKGERKQIVIV